MPDFFVHADYPPHPQCYRAVCGLCGAGRRELRGGVWEKVVDLRVDYDHQDGIYSSLWACQCCLEELGRLVGMVSVAEADDLRAANDRLGELIGDQQLRLGELEPVAAAIASMQRALPETVEPLDDVIAAHPCPECGKPFSHPLPLSAHVKKAHAAA